MSATAWTIAAAIAALLLLAGLKELIWRVAHRGWRLGRRAWRASRATRAGVWLATRYRRASDRFPAVDRFLRARVDPSRVSGLPLTLMAGAALYLLFLLGGIAEEIIEAEEISRIDHRINDWFAPLRLDAPVTLFSAITRMGNGEALFAVCFVATAFLVAHGRKLYVLPLWVCVVGAHVTTYAGKFAFARERPDFVTDVTAQTASFPSAHATGALAVYGFLAYIVGRDLNARRARFELGFWAVAFIALIGFSRVFLSVHFASDVAAGFLVGGFWLLVGFAIAELARERRNRAAGEGS